MFFTKKKMTRADLEKIPVVRKDKFGGRWLGIPHHLLYDAVVGAGRGRHYVLGLAGIAVSKKDQQDVAISFRVRKPTITPYELEDWKFQMGVTSSNSRRSRVRFFFGGYNSRLKINFVSREILFENREARHTHLLEQNLPKLLDRIFLEIPDCCSEFSDTLEDLASREITTREFQKIICAAAKVPESRKGVLPWGRMGALMRLWNKKEVLHNRTEEKTSWRLMVAGSLLIKRSPPLRQMHDLNAFRKLLPTKDMVRLIFEE